MIFKRQCNQIECKHIELRADVGSKILFVLHDITLTESVKLITWFQTVYIANPWFKVVQVTPEPNLGNAPSFIVEVHTQRGIHKKQNEHRTLTWSWL